MSEWEPIETAPKDGTHVLIYQTDVLAPNHYVAAYDDEWGNGEGWWVVCDGKVPDLPLRGPQPTHWMRLPDPPV